MHSFSIAANKCVMPIVDERTAADGAMMMVCLLVCLHRVERRARTMSFSSGPSYICIKQPSA
eukprot:scaffold219005_cov33-Prasinocladus_malaysianus.AAC.1